MPPATLDGRRSELQPSRLSLCPRPALGAPRLNDKLPFLGGSWGERELGGGGAVGVVAEGAIGGFFKDQVGNRLVGEELLSLCALGALFYARGSWWGIWGLWWGWVPPAGVGWSCKVGVDQLEVM